MNEAERTAKLLNTNGERNVFTQRFIVSDNTILPISKDTNVIHGELDIENKSPSVRKGFVIAAVSCVAVITAVIAILVLSARKKHKRKLKSKR